MARISVVRSAGGRRITLRGRLTSRDLGRLEHACGSALEHEVAPLELDIQGVSSLDDPARWFLRRLRARGAHIRGVLIGEDVGS